MRPFAPQRGGPSHVGPAVQVRLPAGVEAPYLARRRLDGLSEYLPPERHADARLLVSELVANALRHTDAVGEEALGLRVETTSDAVRIEVSDPGSGFAPPSGPVPRPSPGTSSGRGLFILDSLSDRWGTEPGRERSVVWFEIDRAPG